MKKLWFAFVIVATLILGACSQVVVPSNPDPDPDPDPNPPAVADTFVLLLTQDHFDGLEEDADLSRERSVETGQIGEKYVFIAGHESGPEYSHIRVFDPDGNEVAEEGPNENWDGLPEAVYHLSFTPSKAGRYYAEMVVSGDYGEPWKDSPYSLTLEVEGESQNGDTDNGDTEEECTSSRRGSLDAPSSVFRNEQIRFVVYVPCGATYASLQVYNNDGKEVLRTTLSSSDLDRYEGKSLTSIMSYGSNDRLYAEFTVRGKYEGQYHRYVTVGSGLGSDDSVDACDLVRWFDITDQDDRRIFNDDVVRIYSGDSIFLNWNVRSAADSVRVTLHRDGSRIYSSRSNASSRNFDYSDLREGDYRARLEVEEGNDDCIRTIDFEVVRGSSGGGGGGGDSAVCPSGLEVYVEYGSFRYEGKISIPRSGEDFRLVWDSNSSDFADGTYVSLFQESTKSDVFQDYRYSGSRTQDPGDLTTGDYTFAFYGYHGDGRMACVREVEIYIQ